MLTLINQNIRSLQRNFGSLLSEIHALDESPNIIVVTEIWAYSVLLNHFAIQ